MDRRKIANKFNEYFGSIASEMNKRIDETGIPLANLPSFESFVTRSCVNSIYLEECTEEEIENIISTFENGKASDIPVRIIKKCSKVISPILKILYNSCITNGVFPSIVKVGKISPIHK